MKIDRIRSLRVSAEWDYHEPLGEAFLSRPAGIYPELAADPALARRHLKRAALSR